MKLQWVLAMMAVAFVLSVSSAFAAKIVVEGEHYKAITPSMTAGSDAGASGQKYVGIPLHRPHATTETGPRDNGYAEYKINVTQAGSYQFWARCRWYDACGNSFFVLVDSTTRTAQTPYITDQTFNNKWHWVAGPLLNLRAGVHTIRIQNREDGASLDQWLLDTRPKNRWEPTRPEAETAQFIVR